MAWLRLDAVLIFVSLPVSTPAMAEGKSPGKTKMNLHVPSLTVASQFGCIIYIYIYICIYIYMCAYVDMINPVIIIYNLQESRFWVLKVGFSASLASAVARAIC